MIERLNKILSVILLTIVAECVSKPLDSKNDGLNIEVLGTVESKITKRSPKPLGVGYVSFGISPPDHEHHFTSDIASHGALKQLVPSFPLQVQEAISVSAIKSEAIHRGPSVAHGAVVNLVGHEIHQTHDPPAQHEPSDHVIVALNKESSIIPHSIGVIHGLTHAVSKAKKTTITSKLSHLITDDDKMIPVITHSVSHIHDEISHYHDNYVPVVPVATHVIVTGHVAKPVSASSHSEHVFEGREKATDDHPVALAQRSNDDDERNRFRDMVGGFGAGLSFGGQGAGHGFYAG